MQPERFKTIQVTQVEPTAIPAAYSFATKISEDTEF